MKVVRVIVSVLVLTSLGMFAATATTRPSYYPSRGLCSTTALSVAMTGDLRVRSVEKLGCEGPWAFLWATVGTGAHAVSVTQLLHYDADQHRWRLASRSTYCHANLLPTYVYRQGCFSN